MPDLLQIDGIRETMKTRLKAAFIMPQLGTFHLNKITHVVTDPRADVTPVTKVPA